MDDQEFREFIAPLVRSRMWMLIISGGLFLVGAAQFFGVIVLVALTPAPSYTFFWKLIGLPAAVLAVLAGWQLFRLYRLFSMSRRSVQASIVSEVSTRARLTLIFTGTLFLLLIFLMAGELFWSAAVYGWR